ncbi:hypothetical protein [Rhabdothermincola salaria]|uniref:hypothetical protein n=1 Tax=Rhabdothermincola salaria TaxID=2903142 RepID=UPI001E344987|nr:hypothetical protein [Rhabdothermincola salaria]MCD9625420.1 hypothetical protein [Rhabdothermincola salaria]
MTDAEIPETSTPQVAGITPVPTVEEAVAVAAALEAGWPRLVVADSVPSNQPSRWRFSGRWWAKPVPARRARP